MESSPHKRKLSESQDSLRDQFKESMKKFRILKDLKDDAGANAVRAELIAAQDEDTQRKHEEWLTRVRASLGISKPHVNARERKPFFDLGINPGMYPAYIAVPNLPEPDSNGHISNMPSEVLIQIGKELSIFDCVCFGITFKGAYNALKAIHKEPIGLETRQICQINHVPGCDPKLSGKPGPCDCWQPESLLPIFRMPDTFKHTDFVNNYRFCKNRGDKLCIFLKKSVYGTVRGEKEKEMFRLYKLFGHFKMYNRFVMKGSSCRLAVAGEALVGSRHRSCLTTSPCGKKYDQWAVEIVESMIEDLKEWSRKGDWITFWNAGFSKYGMYVYDEHTTVLDEAASKHVWPVVDELQRKIAERMVARYCLVNQMRPN